MIARFSDTGILDGITEDSFSPQAKEKHNTQKSRNKKPKKDKKPSSTAAAFTDPPDSLFSGAAILTKEISTEGESNPIYYSVVYNSGYNQACTWDKSRFVDEIKPYNS